MVNFDFVNSIFCGTFMLLETLQNSNGKRHPNMFIIVDFLEVIGRFCEINTFILSKSGFVRKKLGKIIACTWMEYTFGGNLPLVCLHIYHIALHNLIFVGYVNTYIHITIYDYVTKTLSTNVFCKENIRSSAGGKCTIHNFKQEVRNSLKKSNGI